VVVSVVYILFPWQLSEEFVAHASNVNCAKFGRRTSRILITGGEDLKVNLWAVGKPSALLVISYRIFCRFMCIVILTFLVINYLIQLMSLYITEPIGPYKSNWVSELWLFWTYHRCWFCKWNNKNMGYPKEEMHSHIQGLPGELTYLNLLLMVDGLFLEGLITQWR